MSVVTFHSSDITWCFDIFAWTGLFECACAGVCVGPLSDKGCEE